MYIYIYICYNRYYFINVFFISLSPTDYNLTCLLFIFHFLPLMSPPMRRAFIILTSAVQWVRVRFYTSSCRHERARRRTLYHHHYHPHQDQHHYHHTHTAACDFAFPLTETHQNYIIIIYIHDHLLNPYHRTHLIIVVLSNHHQSPARQAYYHGGIDIIYIIILLYYYIQSVLLQAKVYTYMCLMYINCTHLYIQTGMDKGI